MLLMNRLTLFLFPIWFIFLIKWADFLVDGASSLAKKLNISDIIIGLTIVAFGTSAPELVVNITSSLKGATGITIGNVLGSNIANILLILGVAALFSPLKIKQKLLSYEVFFTVLATIIFTIFINDPFIDWAGQGIVSRSEGLVLMSMLWLFLYYIYQSSKHSASSSDTTVKMFSWGKSLLWIWWGLVGLIVWGNWIVDGAVMIATLAGISERVIGLTIIAIGTSLPELATSVMAAYKGKTDLALGNVIGSNLFNILFILGVSSLITPIPALNWTFWDITLLCLATFLLYVFWLGRIGKKGLLIRKDGIIMLSIYILYLAYLVLKGNLS